MPRLLWVEDDASLRRVLRGLLASEGYALTEVDDAARASALIAAGSPWDLVLLDLMLPPSGRPEEGLALLDQLLSAAPDLKVIALSGAGDGIRTHDIQHGKLALYQLSYTREGAET